MEAGSPACGPAALVAPSAANSLVSSPAAPALHVAYLVNLYPAVSQTFIRREIQALERQGVTVQRIAFRGWDDETIVDESDRHELTLTRYVLKQGPSGLVFALLREAVRSPRRMLCAARLAWRMARVSDRNAVAHLAYLVEACVVRRWASESGVDHLHAHFATNPAEVAMLVRALGGPPYSFTAHGSDIGDRPAQVGLPLTVGHAVFVAAVCSFGRSQIFKWVGHELWGRVHVIRCGLQPGYGRDAPPVPAGRRRLLCIGRLAKEKGQLLLLQAVRLLVDAGEPVEVVLAGGGPMRSELESVVADSRLTTHVRFAGLLDASGIENELREARGLVVPSLSEGLPVVIMEAMAVGRPVIAPYIGGIPELVTDRLNGWLYPAGDASALASAMRAAMWASEADLQRMGEAARSAVWTAHDVDAAASRLNELFRASSSR